MQRILAWPRVVWLLVFSCAYMFAFGKLPGVRGTVTGDWGLRISATVWVVSLVVLIPIRVFLDRREVYYSSQSRMGWPRGLRWLGSRWLEVVL